MNKQQSQAANMPVTFEQAKQAIIKLVVTRGRSQAVAVLARFGVENLTRLLPSEYGALVDACQGVRPSQMVKGQA
ncbi:hypothetical protein [Castellaniella sp. MT123]|uniref:hypothetical protein n=1 Tax=Castellaniella sp. MT123 TaxID=3140381 RepID=UPI0031F3955D